MVWFIKHYRLVPIISHWFSPNLRFIWHHCINECKQNPPCIPHLLNADLFPLSEISHGLGDLSCKQPGCHSWTGRPVSAACTRKCRSELIASWDGRSPPHAHKKCRSVSDLSCNIQRRRETGSSHTACLVNTPLANKLGEVSLDWLDWNCRSGHGWWMTIY